MNYKRDELIDVLNFSKNMVCVKVNKYEYTFPPADENDVPSVIAIPFGDIEYINQSTKAFKEGRLRFHEDQQADLYAALRINNWKNILTRSQIVEMIINPKEGDLEKIVSIKSLGIMSVFKGELCRLVNEGKYDISVRMQQIISRRYAELLSGKTLSDLRPGKVVVEKDNNEKIISLEQKILELTQKIAELTTAPAEVSKNTAPKKISSASKESKHKE